MVKTNKKTALKKPFKGLKVFFSGTIRGATNPDPDFSWKLVQYMIKNGADVLSEFVAGRTKKEMDEIFARRTGMDLRKKNKPWLIARKVDTGWLDEATHIVALVDSPSLGVGMEIERAIEKPNRGLNKTFILCLVHKDLIDGLSFMIRGVTKKEAPSYSLKTYKDLDHAKKVVHDFLTKKV